MATKPTDSAGIYVFDFVEPGTYTSYGRITADSPNMFRQILLCRPAASNRRRHLDSRGPGAICHVDDHSARLETTSSNVDLTIDTQMANDTPRHRSQSFQADVDRARGHQHPRGDASVPVLGGQ